MLQNAYFLAKIGADTAENEQHFAEICQKSATTLRVGSTSCRSSGRTCWSRATKSGPRPRLWARWGHAFGSFGTEAIFSASSNSLWKRSLLQRVSIIILLNHQISVDSGSIPKQATRRQRASVGKFSAKCCSFSAVSAPIFARKYAFCSIFQNLPDYQAEFFEFGQIL